MVFVFVLISLSLVFSQIETATIPVHPHKNPPPPLISTSSSSSSSKSVQDVIDVEPIHLPPLVNQIQPQIMLEKGDDKYSVKDLQIQPIEPQINAAQIRQEIHLPIATIPTFVPAYEIMYPVGINYPYNLIAAI